MLAGNINLPLAVLGLGDTSWIDVGAIDLNDLAIAAKPQPLESERRSLGTRVSQDEAGLA